MRRSANVTMKTNNQSAQNSCLPTPLASTGTTSFQSTRAISKAHSAVRIMSVSKKKGKTRRWTLSKRPLTLHSLQTMPSAFYLSSRGMSHLFSISHPACALLKILSSSIDSTNALDLVQTVHGTASSLRQLLSSPSTTTLKSLQTRIKQQASSHYSKHYHRPSTSRSASNPSVEPNVTRFYQLAEQLLDDVAASTAAVTYFDTPFSDAEVNGHSSKSNPTASPKYALYQHLPTGDYFTSAASHLTREDLKSLAKGLCRIYTTEF